MVPAQRGILLRIQHLAMTANAVAVRGQGLESLHQNVWKLTAALRSGERKTAVSPLTL